MADLMRYLPPYWHSIREMIQLQEVFGAEGGQLKQALEDLLNQCFVNTATWGLALWERELGITIDTSRPYERRRERIKAKLRGSGTTTVALIKNVAESFTGGEVEIIEYPDEFRFVVRFIGTRGIPPNMVGLSNTLDEIKPAHLVYDWDFVWTWWDYLTDDLIIWDVAGTGSWNDLKVYSKE